MDSRPVTANNTGTRSRPCYPRPWAKCLAGTPIDDAVQIDDPTALSVLYRLLKEEGLYLGGSSGINVAAAVELARQMGPGHTIVTVLCDGGDRYRSRLYNPEWLRTKGLPVPPWLE